MARDRTRITRGGDKGDGEDIVPNGGQDQLSLGHDMALVGDPGEDSLSVEGNDDANWDVPEEHRNTPPPKEKESEEREERDEEFDPEDARLAYSETGEEDEAPQGRSHRQRRNLRRRMFQQAQSDENEELRRQVAGLTTIVRRLATGQQDLAVTGLEGQMSTLQGQLRVIDEEMANAIKNSDGDTYSRAQRLRDEVVGRLYGLRMHHARMATRESQEQPQPQPQPQPAGTTGNLQSAPQTQAIDPRVSSKFERFLDRFDWFDPQSTDANSNIVRAIDQELTGEGYQRHTTLFWQELEWRMAGYGLKPNQEARGDEDEPSDSRSQQRSSPQMSQRRPPTNGGRSIGSGRSGGFRLDAIQTNILREEGLLDPNLSDEDKAKRDRIVSKWKAGAQAQRRGTLQ